MAQTRTIRRLDIASAAWAHRANGPRYGTPMPPLVRALARVGVPASLWLSVLESAVAHLAIESTN